MTNTETQMPDAEYNPCSKHTLAWQTPIARRQKIATPEQKAKAAERRAAMRAIARKVSALTEEQRIQLVSDWPTTIEGRRLSLFNACFIAMQNPRATVVGGFRQWLKADRVVKKGEHGAAIWFPLGAKNDDGEVTEANELRFGLATVFDVTQTKEKEVTA